MQLGVMAGRWGWGTVEEDGWRKGPWTAEEDRLLIEYVRQHGEGRWNSVARLSGLRRNGKSCRLRWVNYLRPDLKKGQITPHEEKIIMELHAKFGNRWSTIARSLPGRTDNEIKNYWRTHFKKKVKTSSGNNGKPKTRLVKSQEFPQQQQRQEEHLYQQHQQEDPLQLQQVQFNQLDIRKIMAVLDESDHKAPPTQPQVKQDFSSLYYPQAADDQSFFLSMFNNNSLMPPDATNEGFLWDGLWNLNDAEDNFSQVFASDMGGMHNLVTPFC